MKSKENPDDILRKYKVYLKLEKSLSDNTVNAYLADIHKLYQFLADEQIHPLDVTLENLETFSATLRDLGIQPRSQARILSGIRSFYHYLILDDYLEADPSELLESPQVGLHLPEVLTIEEIDNLIENIDLSTKEGQRNRTILETLYSCGLRVSELCNLKISDLYLEEGFIKVEGKGNKQRLIPISPRAIRELQLYFIDRNQFSIKKDYEDYVAMNDSNNCTGNKGVRALFGFMPYAGVKWKQKIPAGWSCPEGKQPGASHTLVNPGWQSEAINGICYVPNMEAGNLVTNIWRRVIKFGQIRNTSTFTLMEDRNKSVPNGTTWYFAWHNDSSSKTFGHKSHPNGANLIHADAHVSTQKIIGTEDAKGFIKAFSPKPQFIEDLFYVKK